MDTVQKTLQQHIIRLAHIGCVVADIDAALINFAAVYGFEDECVRRLPETLDASTQTRFAFFDIAGTEFELIEPVSDHFKTILGAVASGAAGINHVAWIVDSVDAALRTLGESIKPGYVTPDGPIDTGSKIMVYLDPNQCGGALIELIELK